MSEAGLSAFFSTILPSLDERQRRLVAAAMASALGRGGQARVAQSSGLARNTITAGARDMTEVTASEQRIRRPGAGRKKAIELDPDLVRALESLMDRPNGHDPPSPLRWTTKSIKTLSAEVTRLGHVAGPSVVRRTLHDLGYAPAATSARGVSHSDRQDQFEHIAVEAARQLAAGQPVVTVTCRRRGGTGDSADRVTPVGSPAPGTKRSDEWTADEHPDTPAFVVGTINRWWERFGRERSPATHQLMIVTEAGSQILHGPSFAAELTRLAASLEITVTVSHLPPGISRWTRVEQQLTSLVLVEGPTGGSATHGCVVDLVAQSTTEPHPDHPDATP